MKCESIRIDDYTGKKMMFCKRQIKQCIEK